MNAKLYTQVLVAIETDDADTLIQISRADNEEVSFLAVMRDNIQIEETVAWDRFQADSHVLADFFCDIRPGLPAVGLADINLDMADVEERAPLGKDMLVRKIFAVQDRVHVNVPVAGIRITFNTISPADH